MRRTKTLKFNISDPKEKELYDYLQTLAHGEFSERTKLFWNTMMRIAKEKHNPEYIKMKEMDDELNRIKNPWLSMLEEGDKG